MQMGVTLAHDLAMLTGAAVLLSTFGLPWLALSGRHRIAHEGLRTRLVLFAWFHPGWSALLRWVAALAFFGAVWALCVTYAVSLAV